MKNDSAKNPLRILATEALTAKHRQKRMNKDVDRLAKKETNPCRKTWYAGSAIQPGPKTTTAAVIAVVILTLINCELAVRCFECEGDMHVAPTTQQITQMENR